MNYQYPNTLIQVFCKAPIAGQVKTRLIPSLSAEQAAELHQQLTLRTLHWLASSQLCPIQLWCSPSISHPFFIQMAEKFPLSLQLQPSGDLGQRMAYAMNSNTKHYNHTLLIGCDCPSLSTNDLVQAINALSTNYDCVIAPAEDGGYCLIGSNSAYPELFTNIDWGSSTVLSQTKKNLAALSLNYLELKMQWDIDHYTDYLRYLQTTHSSHL